MIFGGGAPFIFVDPLGEVDQCRNFNFRGPGWRD
jgi:hypothetical protein